MSVVSLGAWCDFITVDEYRGTLRLDGLSAAEVERDVEQFERGTSFRVQEFAVLADGRRLTLHDERGFTTWTQTTGGAAPPDPWSHLAWELLEAHARTTVLPDDDDTQDQHPWEWLAELMRAHGVEASPEELRLLPYEVEFSERLRTRLAADT
jgi:hypothetical protein